MLKYPGPGNSSLLGDVPNQEDRDPDLLGEAHQASRRLAHLGDTSGAALEAGIGDRLYGIDDRELRSRRADCLTYGVEIVLGKQQDPGFHGTEPVGSHSDLLRRLLA